MYDLATRRRALDLLAQGRSLNSVSQLTGASRSAIRTWREHPEPRAPSHVCSRCGPDPQPPSDRVAYAYLLGLYLGDGCISRQPRTHVMRIACSDTWPGLITTCETAMRAVRPANRISRVPKQGCVMVSSYSNHWLCLFPQHDRGKKHERAIVLEPWQQAIVRAHPWPFIRGLIHSDGCRVVNWTTKVVGGERKRYEYPRYFFSNKSDDIRTLFTDALRMVGVEWTVLARGADPFNVSIARRASVALMDAHVGPKF
ncbi:transcriptional regulator [Streptomyces carpaticus]|uniref:transcriptional regulator n=1 Tax=Streptomyces carpaticus TaxID=285558 RepID=UPI00220EE129|nr:transcriptional regulator [Streptomyces carpaticus]